MFGAVSPEIGQTDIDQLLGELMTAVAPGGDSRALEGLTQETRLSQAKLAHEEGYDLALQLLESLTLPATGDSFVDIDAILMQLGVVVRDVALDEPTLRGVAFAGGDIHPTVLANTRHRMNTAPSGRRFTLAHELCHILHDRAYGQPLSMVSGPWAPAGVEQRANAFAAMLLMPYELINRLRALSPSVPLDSPEGVKELAGLMQTGFVATLEHLTNIGKLDAWQRERIKTQVSVETGI